MKFAKELERDLVPEWREKYLNYKAGKKYVKAVSRAVQRAQGGTPALGRQSDLPPHSPPSGLFSIQQSASSRQRNGSQQRVSWTEPFGPRQTPAGKGKVSAVGGGPAARSEPSLQDPIAKSPGSGMRYGSVGPTHASSLSIDRNEFALPGPAIKSPLNVNTPTLKSSPERSASALPQRLKLQRRASTMSAVPRRTPSFTQSPMTGNPPGRPSPMRLFSLSPLNRRPSNTGDIGLQHLDQVRQRELEFYKFMDAELAKIETFYKAQEEKASKRLGLLREQLHEMRNRRSEEVYEAKKATEEDHDGPHHVPGMGHQGWVDPLKSRFFAPGPNSKALHNMARTPMMDGRAHDENRDYIRRSHSDVPYRTAKRKLKLALQEFYRGLELLKSYALLNRTAFRKLNKKYDKAINAHPPYRYMNEKVNKSWFVNSDIVDGHLTTVEDLYARYFERGNHKIAAGKLRNLSKGPSSTSANTFLSGLLVGVGSVFAVHGVVYAAELLYGPDHDVAEKAMYLLQIYGGYFLCWYLFTLFCLCARVWTVSKVNYHFIFELDPRNHLDWKELAQMPCFFWCLFGVTMWLNFSEYGNWRSMFLYYPVLLIFITVAIILFPAPVLYHRSRQWLAYSLSRLMLAGFYPVEFRDFFLGDMFCSLTYAMCNIELFFCLYAHYWDLPEQCNSSNSWVLGMLSAVPPFWRAMQCIRRYYDTRNAFPHLANCGKYSFSILAAGFLCVYRMHRSGTNLALLATFSTINSIYCSLWDIFMDASLASGDSEHFLLRDILTYKSVWPYYVFLVLDPILRFIWIFYAIFTYDSQHSTIMSFMVGFAEVSRRGLWTIFRVENEHCANVRQYKASRDLPLPYTIEPFVEPLGLDTDAQTAAGTPVAQPPPSQHGTPAQAPSSVHGAPSAASGPAAEAGTPEGLRSIRRVIAEAHKQDFEKKRLPPPELRQKDFDDDEQGLHSDDDDDDDDDEDDAGDESDSGLESRMDVQRAQSLLRRLPSTEADN